MISNEEAYQKKERDCEENLANFSFFVNKAIQECYEMFKQVS